jgi:aspartate/methionine/tyrosine aminotransferase
VILKHNTIPKLRPLRPAKVSEISETTASAGISADEQIHFHIGNPVADLRLSNLYYDMLFGIKRESNHPREEIEDIDLISEDIQSFLHDVIQSNSPYMARGGYNPNFPSDWVRLIADWLSSGQVEPLSYDFGKDTGRKECIMVNGGSVECMRTIFHALDRYAAERPLRFFLYGFSLPNFRLANDFILHTLPEEEKSAIQYVEKYLDESQIPTNFLILGKSISEETRRILRRLSKDQPIFFVEVNDTPNHLSLAREAGMREQVVRILSPAVINPKLSQLSMMFLLGNSEFLRVLESVQFELKGTPSSSEAALLVFASNHSQIDLPKQDVLPDLPLQLHEDELLQNQISHAQNIFDTVSGILSHHSQKIEKVAEHLEAVAERINEKIQSLSQISRLETDTFASYSASWIIHEFLNQLEQPDWLAELKQNFLRVFNNHHPYYSYKNCQVVSGSSRTALSILGFHCGINEVITADLGWTYEHVFPSVNRIPLTSALRIDINAILTAVHDKIKENPDWKNHGAVIINNPHNASGCLLSEDELGPLIRELLQQGVYLLDDLSYQDIVPDSSLIQTSLVKKICNKLIKQGYLTESHKQYVVTVHSLSKTDSFAGARLAVIEISDKRLFQRFVQHAQQITANHMAILLAYLFYRNSEEDLQSYWLLRNRILSERMDAMQHALSDLPEERNPYSVGVSRPEGSMYPHLNIEKLPSGLSLDWLSLQLARQGIGLVPLSAFAHTTSGYNEGRKSYRLTLGGKDSAETIYRKTRRLVIDLNRVIAHEDRKYRRYKTVPKIQTDRKIQYFFQVSDVWQMVTEGIRKHSLEYLKQMGKKWPEQIDHADFISRYLPRRLSVFYDLFSERIALAEKMIHRVKSDKQIILDQLEIEFYKDNLSQRENRFNTRLYDRTVHPTQMYGLEVEQEFNRLSDHFVRTKNVNLSSLKETAATLVDEYLGLNVALDSKQEGDEILGDLRSIIESEILIHLTGSERFQPLLSYWGDWDGSTRPSGQGHRLVAAVLIENVTQMSDLLLFLYNQDKNLDIDPNLLDQIQKLGIRNRQFWTLLNRITQLTNQLEKRLHTFLPFNFRMNLIHRFARKIHLAKDPLTVLWEHNDRLERKMLDLRHQRRDSLEFYFSLNKRLRKALRGQLPVINEQIRNPECMLRFGFYRDLLQRFVLTPRIHQKIITSDDQFTIDTTVHNISEINEISGRYGNPGMVMALQISMANEAEALIRLDRKIQAENDKLRRAAPGSPISVVKLIPLFESKETIENLEDYLEKVWSYALQSRRINQDTAQRFFEIIAEIFFAGSDLSQQVSQAYAANLYRLAKRKVIIWLSEKGIIGKIRVKLGSGEPMQRQGGYYPEKSTQNVFDSDTVRQKLYTQLSASALQSTRFAQIPLRGILTSGDLRTWQSTISEKLRQIRIGERTEFLLHVKDLQKYDRYEIERITEPMMGTRLQARERYLKELDMFTGSQKDEEYTRFLELLCDNFRQILYGMEEDVVGIHMISHFVSRAMPPLRDRPTVRPSREAQKSVGREVVSRISQTLPLARHGSLLRAIGHNRAQTMVLGMNQLTTGLFRALSMYLTQPGSSSESESLITSRILPHLPVHEILHSLRIYHDPSLKYIEKMQDAFSAGNSAFVALREDMDALNRFIGLFQKELLRRCGIEIADFFDGNVLKKEVLPAFKPEMAVLLQSDLFNTDPIEFFSGIPGSPSAIWKQGIVDLFQIPQEVQRIRHKIWKLIEGPVFIQVSSFVELAMALSTLSGGKSGQALPYAANLSEVVKIGSQVAGLLRSTADDSLRQFLVDVVQLLTELPGSMTEIPVDIIRALRDVERIARLEEQALSNTDQMLLRHYLLNMARLCGENG